MIPTWTAAYCRNGHQTRGGGFREIIKRLGQRPKNQPQTRRCRLQQKWHEDGELAKANAVFTQRATCFLIKRFYIVSDLTTGYYAQGLNHAERKAFRQTVQRVIALQVGQWLKKRHDLAINKVLQAALDFGGHVWTGLFINECLHNGLQRITSCDQLANGTAAPHQSTLFGKINLGVRGIIKTICAQMEFRGQNSKRCLAKGLCLVGGSTCVLLETECFNTAHELALYGDFTGVVNISHKGLLLLEPPQQNTGAAIHKSLGQTLVQSI